MQKKKTYKSSKFFIYFHAAMQDIWGSIHPHTCVVVCLYAGDTASYFPLFISPTSPCHKRPQWLSVPAALSEFVREELTAMGWHQTARGHQDSEEVIFPLKPLSPYWAREVITLDIKSSFVKTLIWKCDGVKWGCEASRISWGLFWEKTMNLIKGKTY